MPVPAAPPAITIRPPHRPWASQAGAGLAVAGRGSGVQPLDLGCELGRLGGQVPGELHCRRAGLAVGDGKRTVIDPHEMSRIGV